MKIIINENQLRLIIENEDGKNLMDMTPILKSGALPSDWDEIYEHFNRKKGGKYDGYYMTGFINLMGSEVTELKHLIVVDGSLIMTGSKFKSLGELESVGSNLVLTDSELLEDLGELKKVGGLLSLGNCVSIKTLDELTSVGGELVVRGCDSLMDLGNLKYVKTIDGLHTTMVTSLGNIEKIGYIYNPKDFTMEYIESLGELRVVEKYLDLGKSRITSLDNLEYVGDFLSLVGSDVRDLGNLKYVGGNLSLIRTPLSEMTTEEEIRNKIKVKGNIYFE